MALVLLMEGINQFVIWGHAVEILSSVFGPISAIPDDATVTEYFDILNQTVYDTLYTFWPITNDTDIIDEIGNALYKISPAANATGNVTSDQFLDATESIVVELFKIVVEDFGFEPPGDIDGLGFVDQVNAYYSVFTLIFGSCFHSLYISRTNSDTGYFFVAAGLVLIGIAVLAWLSMLKEKRTWRHYIGIVSNLLIGLGVALLSIMLLTNASDNLGSSPWTLPLLVFAWFIGMHIHMSTCLNSYANQSSSSPTQSHTPQLAQSRG